MWQKIQYVLHCLVIVLGLFFLGGGTYAVVKQIIAGMFRASFPFYKEYTC
jgi:hypothetical protein